MPLKADVATGTIGLVEPGIGTALPGDNDGTGFQAALDQYRATAGVPTGATVNTVAGGGQAYSSGPSGERSLDVGIAATVTPNSKLTLYAGSSSAAGAGSNAYTAWQSAVWDTTNNPQVVTSSFGFAESVAPGSPFHNAVDQLFTDAALRNISVINSTGDGGSSYKFGNGLTNTSTSRSSPYGLMVGGTSVTLGEHASLDPTLQSFVDKAVAGDGATIWQLISGGLTHSPVGGLAGAKTFIETVWNQYYVTGHYHLEPWRFGLSVEQCRHGRRRYQPASALVPDGLRSPADDQRPQPSAGPRHSRRLSQCWRQQFLDRADGRHARHARQRRHQRLGALLGRSHLAVRRHLQGSGSAAARLHDRPALHRLGDQARLRSTT